MTKQTFYLSFFLPLIILATGCFQFSKKGTPFLKRKKGYNTPVFVINSITLPHKIVEIFFLIKVCFYRKF